MTFGLRVRNAQGAVILDSGDFTYEVIFNTTLDWTGSIGSNPQITYTIPGFDPATCVLCVFLENPGSYDPRDDYTPAIPYINPPSGNSVTLLGKTPGDVSGPDFATGLYRVMAFRML